MMTLTLLICTIFSAVPQTASQHRSASLIPWARDSLQADANLLQTQPYASPISIPQVSIFNNASQFLVNGSGIPDVTFDIGPTYAGLLPISDSNPDAKLFFWYMPANNATDTLTIWLNGGPGCSSLEGAIQENGPFTWQKGTFRPVRNQYSWTNFTNMLYIEQPIGTGFSQAMPTAKNEADVAHQFIGFMEQFFRTFAGTRQKKLFLSGESYAGKYIPYIADAMLNVTGTEKFDLQGVLLIDRTDPETLASAADCIAKITSDTIAQDVPAVALMRRSEQTLGLSTRTMKGLQELADSCGYTRYLSENLVYPARPTGIPQVPQLDPDCHLVWEKLANAAFQVNPDFNIYKITDSRSEYDVLGFPNSFPNMPAGTTIYFAREDVQKAIHAPRFNWTTCAARKVFPAGDSSPDVVYEVLPRVISKVKRTIIAHGLLDFVLIEEGTRLALQNMTWNGKIGFDAAPQQSFSVELQGETGVWQEERNLSYVSLKLSGHMIPADQPASAFKLARFLVGDISSLRDAEVNS